MVRPLYLIEPDPNERRHLQAILATEADPVVVFENAESFLKQADLSCQGCLVASAALPRPGILALLVELERRNSMLSVIVLDRNTALQKVVAIMRAGAFDFVEPSFNDWRLRAALDRLVSNDMPENASSFSP